MSCVSTRPVAHICIQVQRYDTTTTTTTPMDAAVSEGLWEVVEALVLRGVKLTTSNVSRK